MGKKAIVKVASSLVDVFINTPFYPHWLDYRNKKRANEKLLRYFKGKVIETGAGNAKRKDWVLSKSKKVKDYVVTDWSDWDEEFQKQKQKIERFGIFTRKMYGAAKQGSKIDVVCDATNLPFKKATFDTYASFEVIEHIPDYQKFVKEASRVLKKGGYCIVASPFLYREHGGIEKDFQRISRGGYYELASKVGMKVEKIITYSFFGTTMAILTNQFVIRKIAESNIIVRLALLVACPLIFFTANTLGFLIDFLDSDIRFASRYHVVMRKK